MTFGGERATTKNHFIEILIEKWHAQWNCIQWIKVLLVFEESMQVKLMLWTEGVFWKWKHTTDDKHIVKSWYKWMQRVENFLNTMNIWITKHNKFESGTKHPKYVFAFWIYGIWASKSLRKGKKPCKGGGEWFALILIWCKWGPWITRMNKAKPLVTKGKLMKFLYIFECGRN